MTCEDTHGEKQWIRFLGIENWLRPNDMFPVERLVIYPDILRAIACMTFKMCSAHVSYLVTETPSSGSPQSAKPRQVAEGTVEIVDGRLTSHVVNGLAPGKVGYGFR